MALGIAMEPVQIGGGARGSTLLTDLVVLGGLGLATYWLVVKTPAGLEVEAAYYYEEGRVDPHLRSYALGKLKGLQQAATKAHDTALATTIGRYITALGGTVTSPSSSSAQSGSSTPASSTPARSGSGTTATPTTYTVRSGDTLSTISGKVYGTAAYWPALFCANAAHIANPNVIQVGQVLTIPARAEAQAKTTQYYAEGRRCAAPHASVGIFS